MNVPTWADLFAIAEQLRTERDAAIAERDAAEIYASTIERLLVEATVENAALREALQIISQGIDPYEDQLQNWIAGQIDTALGKAQLS